MSTDTLIHADIFFFVTTVVVALIAALFAIVIIYIIRILNDVHYISSVVREETDQLAGDIEELREKVKRTGVLAWFVNMISELLESRGKRSKSKNRKNSKKNN